VSRIEQHGETSLRRPKPPKEEVKRLMKKKKNRTIQNWNRLPAEVLTNLPCKPTTFKKRLRKAIIEVS
jgi:hypothetical protein